MKPLDDLIRTPADFERWLTAQPAKAFVGDARISTCCPLARWLTDEQGTAYMVSGDTLTALLSGAWQPISNTWLATFVLYVDSEPTHVTRERALLIVQHVKELQERSYFEPGQSD